MFLIHSDGASETPPKPPVMDEADEAQEYPEEAMKIEDPYWKDTVDRAVAEFQSDNPEIRRSAVMLIGKYPVPPAREIISNALEDEDPGVRQAALVSALEEPGQMHAPYASKALNLLADPKVSIRRIASSSLSIIVTALPFEMQPGTVQMHRQLPQSAAAIITAAFNDEDVSVRRNMVASYPFLRIELPEETIIALLYDPDIQVAVPVLQWGLNMLRPATMAREVERLAQHDNAAFRLELAKALQSRRTVETLAALENLRNDPHPPVALEARLGVFNQQQSLDLYEEIVRLWRDIGKPADFGQRIVIASQILGERSEPYLREWLEESNSALRQQAAQAYVTLFGQTAQMELVLSLLDDPVQGVRQQGIRALMTSSGRLTVEHLRPMLSNRHVEIRRLIANLTGRLPTADSEEILLELLLDDSLEVRIAALQQIGLQRISGWEEIMGISLKVDDTLVKRTAMDLLIRQPSSEGIVQLKSYLEENPGSQLRPQIEAHLQRHRALESR